VGDELLNLAVGVQVDLDASFRSRFRMAPRGNRKVLVSRRSMPSPTEGQVAVARKLPRPSPRSNQSL
jgi:hypothetical protein